MSILCVRILGVKLGVKKWPRLLYYYLLLYVPVVTLSKDDEIKLLTNLKSGFKREIIWNKCRSQMTTEAINNNLNILADPTFTNVNRLFVLAYRTADDKQSFSQFCLPRVMVKNYNVITDKLAVFDLP